MFHSNPTPKFPLILWSQRVALVWAICGSLSLMLWPTGCVDSPKEPVVEATPEGSPGDKGDAGPGEVSADSLQPNDKNPQDAPPTLKAAGAVPAYGIVDKAVRFDAKDSQGAVKYQWSFGNGAGWDSPRETPDAAVVYKKAGRYQVILQVFDAQGNSEQASFLIAIVHPQTHTPRESSTILRIEGGDDERVAVVSPDSHEVMLLQRKEAAFSVVRRFQTMKNPRTLAQMGDWLLVTCQDEDALQAFSLSKEQSFSVSFDYGSRPYGVIVAQDKIYVTLQAKGQVAALSFSGTGAPQIEKRYDVVKDARGIAMLPDGRLLVSRWRSKPEGGTLAALNLAADKVTLLLLQFDPQPPSDTEIGGVPTYLNQLLVSPTGREVAIPSLQANIRDGEARNQTPLRDDTSLRAIVSYLALPSAQETFQRRLQLDSRGFLSSGVFSSRGDFLFVTARGARIVERIDMLTGVASGTIFDVGYAPEGVTLSKDDRYLYVNAYLSREVVVYDVSSFDQQPTPLARLPIPTKEPLSAQLLLGKRLFNDSSDLRLSKENYIACAHCHLEGDADHLVWDFTQRGEGLRNTISLLGRAGAGDGPIHWSGNFDEIHDFEHDIRGAFGGKGLMTDEQFNQGTRNQTLGDSKAGVSPDLDALAAYVTSLATHRKSPFREKDGALSDAAKRGKELFLSPALGCTGCHQGARMTDSAFTMPGQPLLHDVGTLKPGSGKRLNKALQGIDTPTLHGLWDSAPYLHDGSAATLRDVLRTQNTQDKHGTTSQLTEAQLTDLIAYLNSLDGRRD